MTVLKPSDEELATALSAAASMREQDNDPDHIAKSLLYLEEKTRILEAIVHQADLYINHGQATKHHQELLIQIKAAKEKDLIEHQELLR